MTVHITIIIARAHTCTHSFRGLTAPNSSVQPFAVDLCKLLISKVWMVLNDLPTCCLLWRVWPSAFPARLRLHSNKLKIAHSTIFPERINLLTFALGELSRIWPTINLSKSFSLHPVAVGCPRPWIISTEGGWGTNRKMRFHKSDRMFSYVIQSVSRYEQNVFRHGWDESRWISGSRFKCKKKKTRNV